MKVLDVGPYDAILGYDWLKPRSPMLCHWENKTLSFEEKGKQIFLQGVLARSLSDDDITTLDMRTPRIQVVSNSASTFSLDSDNTLAQFRRYLPYPASKRGV
jgi:hypothetical protein